MFDEEVFINECSATLRTLNDVDYEDVKTEIGLFVENNLPTELKSISYIRHLCSRIFTEYIEFDFENSQPVEPDEPEELDNILYQAVEIWLATANASTHITSRVGG
jgi:hypothetical protein